MDVRLTRDGKMAVRDTDWSEVQKLVFVMPDGRTPSNKMLTFEETLDYLKGKAVVSIQRDRRSFQRRFCEGYTAVENKRNARAVHSQGKNAVSGSQHAFRTGRNNFGRLHFLVEQEALA